MKKLLIAGIATALLIAVIGMPLFSQEANTSVINALIQEESETDIKDLLGRTLLHITSLEGNEDIVKESIKAGDDCKCTKLI